MDRTISAKELRASLPETVERVRRGERLTVLYRSRPAFRIVPVNELSAGDLPPLKEDPVYRAAGVGRSRDRKAARDHDLILYPGKAAKRRRSR
ncbi:MAG: type II toxin-antitoxin system Phd/YefM family antitoxin [Betaproteobacteria bacterium]